MVVTLSASIYKFLSRKDFNFFFFYKSNSKKISISSSYVVGVSGDVTLLSDDESGLHKPNLTIPSGMHFKIFTA